MQKAFSPVLAIIAALIVPGDLSAMKQNDTKFIEACQALEAKTDGLSESERLHQLFEMDWENRMLRSPESATYNGFAGQDDRWTDRSFEAIEFRRQEQDAIIAVLESINRSELHEVDRLSYDLFMREKLTDRESRKYQQELMPINQMGGVHQTAAEMFGIMSTDRKEDYENIIARLKALPDLISQTIMLMEKGLEQKITPPRVTMRDLPEQVLSQIAEEPSTAPMLEVFGEFPETVTEKQQTEIQNEAYTVYRSKALPSLKRLHTFLVSKYIPGCREEIGLSALPLGKEWYEYLCRYYTTTDLTPNQIHEIGLGEVKRIRAEMEEIIDSTGFKGDFGSFCEFLRTSDQFYFTEARDLVREYRDISKRADAQLVKLFGVLPRLPYGVIEIPDYGAKSQTTAYYQPGSHAARRPGYYFVNTYDLASRPKWEMEALSLHEAVPGHHLQISIARELTNLPRFRRNSWITAYGEGWGLYAEKLGEEMGFYEDPYSKFGQLTYEMWRAIRLVVDVGMHYKGWTREQAIEYFKENSSKSEHDIIVEIDRYIVWPGQALAYKIGELKIRELRAYAEKELGDTFDIRGFHDTILETGPIPLMVLEERIKDWVETRRQLQVK
ncbi:MAG: DUF885 domain-containing protein [bacterium]|nr:DUF885 domain-containing protein [bacterium]